MNMSYCRFQNTERDFEPCAEVIEELLLGDGELSSEELAAAGRLICKAWTTALSVREEMIESGVLDPNGEMSPHLVTAFLKSCLSCGEGRFEDLETE